MKIYKELLGKTGSKETKQPERISLGGAGMKERIDHLFHTPGSAGHRWPTVEPEQSQVGGLEGHSSSHTGSSKDQWLEQAFPMALHLRFLFW